VKALITGLTGFIGQYLANSFLETGYEVLGTGWTTEISGPLASPLEILEARALDVRNRIAVEALIETSS